MPRRKISNAGDAALLLADVMARFVRMRADSISGNDLHALNAAVEMYIYAQEVDFAIRMREKSIRATGVEPIDLDIDTHRVLQGIKKRMRMEEPGRPEKARACATAKPSAFREAEKSLGFAAREKLPALRHNPKMVCKLKPRPKRSTGIFPGVPL